MTGIPITWAELEARHRERAADTREFLSGLPQALAGLVDPLDVAAALAGVVEELAPIAVFDGPGALAEVAAPLQPLLARSTAAVDRPPTPGAPEGALDSAAIVNLLRCAGMAPEVGDEAVLLERSRRHAGALTDERRQMLALMAVALGRPDLVVAFVGPGPLRTFEPGRAFGPDTQGFTTYLALALEAGAAPAGVRPAWHALVERFPLQLGAMTMTWADLLFAARAVVVHVEGRPVGTVVAELRSLVT